MRRRGFTIIELLVVIAIIGILGTIVTAAASGALKGARAKRTEAMRVALEQGIAAYYAQRGEWPRKIETKSKDMEEATYTFSESETDDIFYQVVGAGFGKDGVRSVFVDAMGLFVANRNNLGNSGKGCYDNHSNKKTSATFCGGRGCKGGVDFSRAVARSGKDHIRLADMAFGYQGKEEGKFCRFWVEYNGETDSVSVKTRGPDL